MEIQEIITLMESPEKLFEPNQIVLVQQYVSEFIDHYENMIYEQKLRSTEEWMRVRAELSCTSDKVADSRQQGMPEHKKLHELEMLEKRLRRYRSDLKDKLNTIMRTKGGF